MFLQLLKRPGKRMTIVLLLLLVVVVVAVLELTNTTHIFHRNKEQPAVSGSSFNTKGEKKPAGESSSGTNTGNTGSSSSSASSSGNSSSNAVLFTPTGSFVSNHHPNLSGSPAPNTMSSVCNTTPRATCKITFTKDGSTKELPAHTVDANGSAYWNWKLQDIGLTAGTWKITAVASLNGQTKTASDAMDLVVAQ